MTLEIRPLREADAAGYRSLRLRALREHPEAFTSSFEEEDAKPLAWAQKRLARSAESPHDFLLGAFVEGKLAGMVGVSIGARNKERHKGHVFGMYVAAEQARRGLGRTLLQACIERARAIPGLEQLQLTVTDSNTRAKSFYEAAGFRAFGLERGAVKLGERYFDKCHMALKLEPG